MTTRIGDRRITSVLTGTALLLLMSLPVSAQVQLNSAVRQVQPGPAVNSTQRQLPANMAPPPVCNTGPVPQVQVKVQTTYVVVSWNPVPGAQAFSISRTPLGQSVGAAHITPAGFFGSLFWDAVPDPRYSYQYAVTAIQSNGCVGTAAVSVAPPYATPNPTYIQAQRTANGSAQITWNEMPGAIAYRVDGPSFPNTGFMVAGETFVPGSAPQTAGPQQIIVSAGPPPNTSGMSIPAFAATATAIGNGAYNFAVTALYPGNIADYAHPAVTSLPVIAARYRITINGFWCINETYDDPLNRDGAHDEIYASVYVHQINRQTLTERASYNVRTPVYGEGLPRFSGRVSAGSGSSTGGIAHGDIVPNTAIPGVRVGNPPNTISTTQTLPAVVWQGLLANQGDVLVLEPMLWEYDGISDVFDNWVTSQRQTQLSSLWAQPAVQRVLAGASAQTTTAAGATQFPMTFSQGLGLVAGLVDPIAIGVQELFSGGHDREVGLRFTGNGVNLGQQQPMIVLSREAIEFALAHDPAGPLRGVIPVAFDDGPSVFPFLLQGSYRLYLQVEQLPGSPDADAGAASAAGP